MSWPLAWRHRSAMSGSAEALRHPMLSQIYSNKTLESIHGGVRCTCLFSSHLCASVLHQCISASVPRSRQSRSLHLLNPFFQGRNAFSTGRRHQHVISADIGVAEDLEQKHKLKIEPYIFIYNMWYMTYYKINIYIYIYIYIHILCICWSIYNSAYVYLSINSHFCYQK